MPFDDQRRWTFTRARIRVPDRAALHEDDRVLPIPAHRRRRQAEDEPRLGAFQDGVEGNRSHVMTFVDDDLPVCFDDWIDSAMPRQGLHHGNVDLTGTPRHATADGPDHMRIDTKECLESLLPLRAQVAAMHQDQRIDASTCDHRSGDHRLAERRWCAQDARVRAHHRFDCPLLLVAQRTGERHVQDLARTAPVMHHAGNPRRVEEACDRVETASGQKVNRLSGPFRGSRF